MSYCSVGIGPSQYHMSAVKWKFDGDKEVTYLVDTRLMMDAGKSPFVFRRLSQAVERFIREWEYQLIACLNDYIIVADDYFCRAGTPSLDYSEN